MKFLLTAINAKFIHSNPAIYSLRAGVGEKLQPYVELAEFTINESLESILEGIWKRQPKVIGFSCYIWNWKLIREILTELPKILPDTEIWLGGPEVTYDGPGLLSEFPQVTGIMVGEGEVTFREVLGQYVREAESTGQSEQQPEPDSIEQQAADRTGTLAGKSVAERFGQIPGLCLASGYTAPRELTDLTTLPFLYEDMEPFTNRIIYYETSRGCPYRCSYCLSSIDKKVRLRDIDVVKRELQFFLDHKVPQVKFVDRTFNCKHDHAMAIWKYIQEHDNGITNFHFEVAADLLNEAELAEISAMREGLVQLEIGVQSTNLQTIEAIDRTMNLEKLKKVVASVHSAGNVHQHLDLIAGLPYENLERFEQSFNDVYNMQPDQLQLGFLKVLKGSKMYQNAKEYGIVYTDTAPYEVLYTKWISYADVLTLKAVEEMVELYYNSRQYVQSLTYLREFFDTPYAMFAYLADYYEKNGLFAVKHSRMTRYQHFYDAAKLRIMQVQKAPDSADFSDTQAESGCEKTKDMQMEAQLEFFTELLIFDLYERENLKTRPPFAPDLQPYKNVIREMAVVYAMPKTAHFELLSERTLQKAGISVDLPERNLKKQTAQSNPKVQISETQNQNSFRNRRIWTAFDYEKRSRLDYGAAVYLLVFEDTLEDKKQ